LTGEGPKKPHGGPKSPVGLSSRPPPDTDASSRFIRRIKVHKER
jgi:hypothetical protein